MLDDVSLTIRAGEHTAILGPNGAGKSILVRLLTHAERPLAPANGTAPVRVFGEADVEHLRPAIAAGHRVVGPASSFREREQRRVDQRRGRRAVGVPEFVRHPAVWRSHGGDAGEGGRRARGGGRVAPGRADAGRDVERRSPPGAAGARVCHRAAGASSRRTHDRARHGGAARRSWRPSRRLARAGTTLVLVTHHVEEIVPEIERVVLLRDGKVAAHGRTKIGADGIAAGQPLRPSDCDRGLGRIPVCETGRLILERRRVTSRTLTPLNLGFIAFGAIVARARTPDS